MTLSLQSSESARSVLNVGGNNKAIEIPKCFQGWRHDLLDIDPLCNPDVLCDARELWKLPVRQYDAVYCSHNLEHYYAHDVVKVLKGFRLVLKRGGFAYIRVPDLLEVMKAVVENEMDIEDILYTAPSGPIRVLDVIYGFQSQIERSGKDFFAHKTGFTEKTLIRMIMANGFPYVYSEVGDTEIFAIAFLDKPSQWQEELLSIKIK
ncbi:MAG: methyltransferase [Geobacteraceae bacterium GWC2_55_20]|nr:MAG: methyltransferase [Geobacteraceae bacterium GWC2_55_20]OGU24378.1 MAG: methyltransferase [Geobacteraceae bacterium GWF2_54_21]